MTTTTTTTSSGNREAITETQNVAAAAAAIGSSNSSGQSIETQNRYQRISAPGLFVQYEGSYYPAHIYQDKQNPGYVHIYFPGDRTWLGLNEETGRSELRLVTNIERAERQAERIQHEKT